MYELFRLRRTTGSLAPPRCARAVPMRTSTRLSTAEPIGSGVSGTDRFPLSALRCGSRPSRPREEAVAGHALLARAALGARRAGPGPEAVGVLTAVAPDAVRTVRSGPAPSR